jgi:hypothetical protein
VPLLSPSLCSSVRDQERGLSWLGHEPGLRIAAAAREAQKDQAELLATRLLERLRQHPRPVVARYGTPSPLASPWTTCFHRHLRRQGVAPVEVWPGPGEDLHAVLVQRSDSGLLPALERRAPLWVVDLEGDVAEAEVREAGHHYLGTGQAKGV